MYKKFICVLFIGIILLNNVSPLSFAADETEGLTTEDMIEKTHNSIDVNLTLLGLELDEPNNITLSLDETNNLFNVYLMGYTGDMAPQSSLKDEYHVVSLIWTSEETITQNELEQLATLLCDYCDDSYVYTDGNYYWLNNDEWYLGLKRNEDGYAKVTWYDRSQEDSHSSEPENIEEDTEVEVFDPDLINSISLNETEEVADNSSNLEINGFRDFEWGSSLKEIEEAVITDDMVLGEDYVYDDSNPNAAILFIMDGSVSRFAAEVSYIFQEDLLVGGCYSLKEEHTNDNSYYDDYCELVESYTDVYGEALYTEENWFNDKYEGEEENIGKALAYGHVQIYSFWMDDNGNTIIVNIDGDNYEISTTANYYSSKYESKPNTNGI